MVLKGRVTVKPKLDLGVSVEELAARYRAGESLRVLGRSLGVSARTVRDRLLSAGVELRVPGRMPGTGGEPKDVGISNAEMARRYKAGESLRMLAESLDSTSS
ncbi:hypothetical protein [Acrocarpospora sp. B8E8]|uniref:helix-turn-helix domain-containing protein n=1 Tax=Acrocarpospora sp. B8E8 TaxID=3153572 RepID=UPI00325DB1DF